MSWVTTTYTFTNSSENNFKVFLNGRQICVIGISDNHTYFSTYNDIGSGKIAEIMRDLHIWFPDLPHVRFYKIRGNDNNLHSGFIYESVDLRQFNLV